MRWLRGFTGASAVAFGLYSGVRAVDWVAAHDYVLALVSALVAISALRAGTELFATETAE